MRRRNVLITASGILLAAIALRIGLWIFAGGFVPPKISEAVTAFADILGVIISAFAFAGFIYTALMQREELSLQREELKETREELKRSADAQEASEKALAAQVEAAQLSARLNAISTLIKVYDDGIRKAEGTLGNKDLTNQEALSFSDSLDALKEKYQSLVHELSAAKDVLERKVHAAEQSTTSLAPKSDGKEDVD